MNRDEKPTEAVHCGFCLDKNKCPGIARPSAGMGEEDALGFETKAALIEKLIKDWPDTDEYEMLRGYVKGLRALARKLKGE